MPPDPFGAAIATPIGPYVTSVQALDVDRDGRVDLAVGHRIASSSSDDLAVFLGNGDGTFRAAGSVAGASRAVATDVNGDGRPDLAYCGNGNRVLVRLGNGDATFTEAVAYASGPASSACGLVAAGDVDGDGRIDLVVASSGAGEADPTLGARRVDVLRGTAAGGFAPPIHAFDHAGTIRSMTTVPLDADRRADLVVNWVSLDAFSAGVESRLARADATFGAPTAPSTPAVHGSRALCCADFDGDGDADAVLSEIVLHLTDRFEPKRSFLLLGNGDGSFRTAGQLVDKTAIVGAWADFDRDGRLDLVIYHGENVDTATEPLLLFGNGNGSFAPPTPLVIPAGVTGAADFTGDGRADLLLIARPGFADQPASALVVPNRIERRP